MKFSIIVPVYNTEKYIKRCLDSVLNQTYKNYELIVINDGSTDGSEIIIKNYCNDNSTISYYSKNNGGLSSARNFGIEKASGDYFLFLDSDDYFDSNFLKNLNDSIEDGIEIIRFQAYKVTEFKKEDYLISNSFSVTTGEQAFIYLYTNKSIELATLYLFNREYWQGNNFSFPLNKYHEDFGLIPLVILNAKRVKSIDYKGYYYFDRPNSITTNKSYDNIKKRALDVMYHFDFLLKESRKLDIDSNIQKTFESFISNSLVLKIRDLKRIDKKKYIMELKKRNVLDLFLDDSIKRKLKKIILKIKYNL